MPGRQQAWARRRGSLVVASSSSWAPASRLLSINPDSSHIRSREGIRPEQRVEHYSLVSAAGEAIYQGHGDYDAIGDVRAACAALVRA